MNFINLFFGISTIILLLDLDFVLALPRLVPEENESSSIHQNQHQQSIHWGSNAVDKVFPSSSDGKRTESVTIHQTSSNVIKHPSQTHPINSFHSPYKLYSPTAIVNDESFGFSGLASTLPKDHPLRYPQVEKRHPFYQRFMDLSNLKYFTSIGKGDVDKSVNHQQTQKPMEIGRSGYAVAVHPKDW